MIFFNFELYHGKRSRWIECHSSGGLCYRKYAFYPPSKVKGKSFLLVDHVIRKMFSGVIVAPYAMTEEIDAELFMESMKTLISIRFQMQLTYISISSVIWKPGRNRTDMCKCEG